MTTDEWIAEEHLCSAQEEQEAGCVDLWSHSGRVHSREVDEVKALAEHHLAGLVLVPCE